MIPKGWEKLTVGTALKIKNNLRKPLSAQERGLMKGEYPYYGPTKVQDWINEFSYEGRYVLIGEDGDHFLKFRVNQMTQIVEGKFNVNNHAHVIGSSNICSVDWFHCFFQNRDISAFLTRQGAKRYKLNKAALEVIPILVPPLPEQKRIAEILSTWDRAIEVTEKLIANSEAQKKALMQKLLTGKERLPGFEGEWDVSKFADVFEIFIGGTPSRKNEEYWDNDKLTENYWVAISDLKEKYLSDTKERITQSGVENSNVKLLQSNTVVFSFKLSIGKKSILQKPAYTNEAICALLPKSNSEINQLFVYHMLGHMDLEVSVDQAVKGKTLNKAKIASLDLRHPKIKEQMEIVQILEAADDELIALNNCLASLTAEKSALMQQLLTGKRRVKIDKEAAA